jgi:recombination protein RecT
MTVASLKAAATGTAVSPVAKFSHLLDKMKPQMALALPKHMNADRMARLALTAFSTTPALQECSTQSIMGSLMVAVQLGLEPGINGQGYLIPYKRTCTFVPGWKGLVDLVARSGRATVWTGTVFLGDEFEYQLGDAPFCRHKPGDSDGLFTHVYAIGRVRDSQMPVIEVWSRGKVEKHLKQYNKVGAGHYARSNENNFEMYARKVALLQVLKYMPSSIELANALTVSQAADEGRGAVLEGDFVTVMDTPADNLVDPETGEILKPTNATARTGAPDGGPDADHVKVLAQMLAAKTTDALDDAASLISAVADPGRRADLNAKYDALRAELANADD